MASTSRREIARPSPVPPKRRAVVESTWLKAWNRRSSLSAGMPMPVSLTHISSISVRGPPLAVSRLLRTETNTSPWSVNFSALEIRLTSTCRSRARSP